MVTLLFLFISQGLIAAKTSARKGAATVLLLNRPSERATNAEETIKAALKEIEGSTTVVETIPCDLQDFESVKACATKIKAKYDAIDVLCCNAGVMALDDNATKDGYDVQMQTNHLSHFLLCKELFPLVKKANELRGEARIVHHSSLARAGAGLDAKYFGKNGGNLGGNGEFMFTGAKWSRYHQTKLANAVMTMALKDRLKESGIKATVAAPGIANTNLQKTTKASGGMSGSMWIMRFSQAAEDGTMPLLAACFDPEANNGDFYEPSGWRAGMTGPAVKKKLEKVCMDEKARQMLWEESEKACGKFEIDL